MPGIPQRDEYTEFGACVSTMRRFEINTKPRAAAWLANLKAESGDLNYTQEIASGIAYEWRRDLGNVRQGDGVLFKGRGYIQLTGRRNYTVFARAMHLPFVDEPDLVEMMPHRWTVAGFYWKNMSSWGDLNRFADVGDFDKTVIGVRGGPDPRRTAYYRRAMQVLPEPFTLPVLKRRGPGPVPGKERPPNLHRPTPGHKAPEVLPGPKPITLPMPQWDRGSGPYVARHPTHYQLDPPTRALVVKYLNDPRLRGRISINNYREHPPIFGRRYEMVSYDVWPWAGRGHPLTPELRKLAFNIIWHDESPPAIDWCISGGGIWTPENGCEHFGGPEDGSDIGHFGHNHWSMRGRLLVPF